MKTFKLINSNTSIILNNQSIYTIDKNLSPNPNKFITLNSTTYFFQGDIIIEE